MKVLSLSLLIAVFLPASAGAKTIYFGSGIETVPLAAGYETLLRFPGEVRHITRAQRYEIGPADGDQPNYALLKVKPRFPSGSDKVVFVLSDGTTINTNLSVAPPTGLEKADAIYEFKPKESLLSNGDKGDGSPLSELDLMKAMIRGDDVAGYTVRDASRPIGPGFPGVSIRLIRAYLGNQLNGFVFEIRNTTEKKTLSVAVQNLSLGDPNLAILSSVDREIIEPEKTGRHRALVRIVAKPTSFYNQLVLPIETVEKR